LMSLAMMKRSMSSWVLAMVGCSLSRPPGASLMVLSLAVAGVDSGVGA